MQDQSLSLSEQPVILEKPAILSRLFLWMIMLMTSSAVIWAYFAQIDQAIPAIGKLELKDGSIDVQAPTSGNVVRLHVESGDRVEKNQPLLTFNPTVPSADLGSAIKLRETIKRENKFYQEVLDGKVPTDLPPDLQKLAQERQTRISENQAYRALINELYLNRGGFVNIDPSLQGLYVNYKAEYNSRVGTVELQIRELEKQLEQAKEQEEAAKEQLRVAQDQLQYSRQQLEFSRQQLRNTEQQRVYANDQLKTAQEQLKFAREQLNNTREQLNNTRAQLEYSQEQLKYSKEQLELAKGQLEKSGKVLNSNQGILEQISPLVEEGAIAELQKKRQEQEVFRGESEMLRQQDQIQSRAGEINTRLGEINSRKGEINTRKGEINSRLADINARQGEVNSQLANINTLEGEINSRKGEINSRQAEINARAGEVKAREAEVQRAKLEQQRLIVSIRRTKEQLKNTRDAWARELYARTAENEGREIARIDSQFTRLQLDNNKRLTEVNAQIEKLEEARDNQVLKSPVSGVIFDLQPTTKEESSLDINTDPICQYVIKEVLQPGDIQPQRCEDASFEAQQTQPLLTVLDDDEGLEAVVYIQNKDVALVLKALNDKRKKLELYHEQELAGGEVIQCEPGKKCVCPELRENREKLGLKDVDCVPVEVQVEALPANEFGTATGEVVFISNDAIPPSQEEGRAYFSFETKIELERQTFVLGHENDLEIGLQNGMAINSNINVGKRTVLELFFNRFTGKFQSLTNVN
ncbi:chromosome partitioning protein ParA [Okeania sp.]|uniref:chromosome partitioning protein ParA n=1 Tax=Okeania sp. TaxID=3100323 RepID=UPI002B4B563D|nr:chromosome partitioning protein ParA [Okeania sp.]MEB3339852.1 chromosome partitioning protein ParA [Okeania sp.]